jgi:hypothetical protein
MQGYSTVLHKNIFGEMNDAHRKALEVILDCCDTAWKSWINLCEFIEQNEEERAMEILLQVDGVGQSYLERNFILTSLAAMEIAEDQSSTILQQAELLTEEQKFYVEIVHNNCQREIEVWKEIAEYFS